MMQTESMNLELSLEDFIVFRDFIHEKCAMYFAENKKYLLENRLSKRIATLGLKSYKDYFYQVKYDTTLKEFNMLMNLVTTNEISFFRNPPQLKSFQEEVLPLVLKRKKEQGLPRRLKLWSAGCSTGEEPYTLAIIALEVLGERTLWKVEIIANDISENVLYAARKGIYNEMTLRSTPRPVLNRYFTKDGNRYLVNENVKRLVKFTHLNLADRRKLALINDIDIVFCRNVMIYFSDEIKKAIVRNYYNALRPGGYFFIGHSESLHGISKAFKLVYFQNALVYHREPGTAGERPRRAAAVAAEVKELAPVGKAAAATPGATATAHEGDTTMDKLKKIQELLAKTRK